MNEKKFSKLISSIYDAALEPTKWQNVIDLLSSTLDGRSSFIYQFNTRTQCTSNIFFGKETNQDYLNQFREHYVHVCPYPVGIHELRSGSINDQMILSRSDAYKTE